MDDADAPATPPPSSQVHTHELTGPDAEDHPCDRGSVYERFRHRHWNHLRHLAYDALEDSGASVATLRRFAQCGRFAHAWHSASTKRLVITADTCRCRWCDPCARSRRSKISSNLTKFCEGRRLRLHTYTLQHNRASLPDLLTRLWASFKLLRRRPDWQAHVTGFAAFVHVKWSDRSKWWHVHLHVLCEGSWWDSREVSRAWHAVTADSMVVDLREVQNEEGVRYASRYAAQPLHLGDVPFDQRPRCMRDLYRRRLWLTGGSWKSLDMLATDPLPDDLKHLDTLSGIIHRAGCGDVVATEVLAAIVGEAVDWFTRPYHELDHDPP